MSAYGSCRYCTLVLVIGRYGRWTRRQVLHVAATLFESFHRARWNSVDMHLAARNLAGGEESYKAVPRFWSDQYDHTLHIAGLIDEGRTTIMRNLGEATLAFRFADDGRLVAASGFGPISKVAKDIRLAEMLTARQARAAAAAALAAPDVK